MPVFLGQMLSFNDFGFQICDGGTVSRQMCNKMAKDASHTLHSEQKYVPS